MTIKTLERELNIKDSQIIAYDSTVNKEFCTDILYRQLDIVTVERTFQYVTKQDCGFDSTSVISEDKYQEVIIYLRSLSQFNE